ENRFAQSVLSVILGGGMSSRLFTEVRERRGLAYSVKTSIERYQETGYLATYAGVDLAKIDEAIKIIVGEHYKLTGKKDPITVSELKKAKEYIKGHLALSLEDTKNVNSFFTEQVLFLNKVKTPKEVFKAVDKVRMDDVYKQAKRLFVPERLNLAIIGPYKDEQKFVKLIK
ncbi:M16 family metallopeptidase, partial [Patescibacteria group bacterium]